MISIAKPLIGLEEKNAVMKVLDSGMIASGPRVEEFEKRFAEFVGTKHALATSSGTTALHLGLLSLGIKTGDEVIVPSFSFVATANSILFCGAIERLNELHYQARWEASAAGPRLIMGHCPYAAIVADHPELCRMDAFLLETRLNASVEQIAKLQLSEKSLPFCAFLMVGDW